MAANLHRFRTAPRRQSDRARSSGGSRGDTLQSGRGAVQDSCPSLQGRPIRAASLAVPGETGRGLLVLRQTAVLVDGEELGSAVQKSGVWFTGQSPVPTHFHIAEHPGSGHPHHYGRMHSGKCLHELQNGHPVPCLRERPDPLPEVLQQSPCSVH